jgi:hypothetical protein
VSMEQNKNKTAYPKQYETSLPGNMELFVHRLTSEEGRIIRSDVRLEGLLQDCVVPGGLTDLAKDARSIT